MFDFWGASQLMLSREGNKDHHSLCSTISSRSFYRRESSASRDRFSMYEQSLQSVTSQGHPQMDRLGCPIEMEPKTLNEGELRNARVNIPMFSLVSSFCFRFGSTRQSLSLLARVYENKDLNGVSVLESTVESSHGGR